MSYAPTTDFLALLRNTSGGERLLSMPGLDFVVSAMARAGIFRLWIGQTAPTDSQAITVWLNPAQPSWSAEGLVLLWNAATATFEAATPALWFALLSQGSGSYVFQSVTSGAGVVGANTTLLAVQRNNPASTLLTLPLIATRYGRPLQIVDFSTAVVSHLITYVPSEPAATVMQKSQWQTFSTPDQLAGLTLFPSIDLNAWVIAP